MPNRYRMDPSIAELPIRILLVSPRPEDEYAPYIDHRVSAQALVSAVENLGELAELAVLNPPTFPALRQALEEAAEAGEPFDMIHFDGHGVYDRRVGLGALIFEDPNDVGKLSERASQLVDAQEFSEMVRDYRIPLVFLEACQGAQFDKDPTASVAAKLLDAGVTSVVAMTHSVLVETAQRFTQAFYQSLAEGQRVGQAMLAGQNALAEDTYRGRMMGAGDLHLQDWFVPVLYQEEQDPQLFTQTPDEKIKHLQEQRQALRLDALPEPPPHTFIGRSRELLALERLLLRSGKDMPQYAVIVGTGGVGKTTIAVELARWLACTARFGRVAFASLEFAHDAHALLDTLGHQLLPEGDKYSVATYKTLDKARLEVDRALRDQRVLLVVDNVESILPSFDEQEVSIGSAHVETFDLLTKLLSASPYTRLLLTSRETLPAPFDVGKQYIRLGALSQHDAVNLVSHVLAAEGAEPLATDPGQTPEEVTALVEAVGRHARALVLIAREVANRGVVATTESLSEIMAELERQHPGERENSLFASVELSLRRLSDDAQRQIQFLGAFHNGVSLLALAQFFDLDDETAKYLGGALIEVGLAEEGEYGYLNLDPALPPYLWSQMSVEEQTVARERWGQAMHALVVFLYGQYIKDRSLCNRLTMLELPNLLAALDWAEATWAPEEMIGLASAIEQLLANLDRPRALVLTVAARERVAKKLGDWSHAQYLAGSRSVDRLLQQGNLPVALSTCQLLLQRALAAGETAYSGADYDIAYIHWLYGRVLNTSGAAAAALGPLTEAQHRFEILGEHGAKMASATITEQADCLRAVGRLENAATAYQEAIKLDEKRGDMRDVAVGKGQLGAVWLLQQRYQEALDAYAEARVIFDELGEPRMVAAAWHQIGMVNRFVGNYPEAERAYRQSLAINVGQGNLRGQGNTLDDLGLLYQQWGRIEEAVVLHQQAADIRFEIKDWNAEGRSRNNMASALIELQRYDEARRELLRAIECKLPYGHAAEPWKAWFQMEILEKAVGDEAAATQAREKAKATYLAYRRNGGYAQPGMDEHFGITEADLRG